MFMINLVWNLNKIRVVGESTLHILKSTGREGVARGTVDKRRGHFLVLGV